jgi:hypothetical protein
LTRKKKKKVGGSPRQCFYDLFEEYRSMYAPNDDLTSEVNEDQTQKEEEE